MLIFGNIGIVNNLGNNHSTFGKIPLINPNSRSLEGVKIMAQDWGRRVGRKYVEAFELIRSIRDHL